MSNNGLSVDILVNFSSKVYVTWVSMCCVCELLLSFFFFFLLILHIHIINNQEHIKVIPKGLSQKFVFACPVSSIASEMAILLLPCSFVALEENISPRSSVSGSGYHAIKRCS